MVKLYIKQKVFSIKDKYKIYDENQNVLFHCISSISLAAKIKMFDFKTNTLLFIIRQKLKFSLYKYYSINDANDNKLADVRMNSLFSPGFEIYLNENEKYDVKGSLFAYNFTIYDNGVFIGSVSKKVFSFGDSYELDVSDNFDPSFFAAFVIAIDDCLHNGNK